MSDALTQWLKHWSNSGDAYATRMLVLSICSSGVVSGGSCTPHTEHNTICPAKVPRHKQSAAQCIAADAPHILPSCKRLLVAVLLLPSCVQLVSTGRGQLSTARMRAHVHRIKSVLLDWLPRRLDPLAFYHWRRPRRNLLVMWLLSHVCMYPSHWLLAVAVIFTLVLLWRIAIQVGWRLVGGTQLFRLD